MTRVFGKMIASNPPLEKKRPSCRAAISFISGPCGEVLGGRGRSSPFGYPPLLPGCRGSVREGIESPFGCQVKMSLLFRVRLKDRFPLFGETSQNAGPHMKGSIVPPTRAVEASIPTLGRRLAAGLVQNPKLGSPNRGTHTQVGWFRLGFLLR